MTTPDANDPLPQRVSQAESAAPLESPGKEMSSPIDRPSPGEFIADVKRWVGYAEVIDKELDEIPWFGPLRVAVRATQKLRLKHFLSSISTGEGKLNPEDRARFDEWVNSSSGRELLSDYAQTVVRTSSRTAAAALGLLYSAAEGVYSEPFRRLACEALEGISDDLVDQFLSIVAAAMASEPAAGFSEPGYRLGILRSDSLTLSMAEYLVALRWLTNRGLLLPDPVPARTGGGYGSLAVGIGEDTQRFSRLLGEARDIRTA